MAASFSCDGCGASVETPAVIGFVMKRDYCEACAKVAKKFFEAEDVERQAVRVVFLGKREKLIEQYGADGFKLPDVP